jgi:hypothetical protein
MRLSVGTIKATCDSLKPTKTRVTKVKTKRAKDWSRAAFASSIVASFCMRSSSVTIYSIVRCRLVD